MHHPAQIADLIQANLHEHHEEEHHEGKDMHIYLDGVRQNHVAVPYKTGFRYVPTDAEDEKFIDTIRKQPGTIDLSGGSPKSEEPAHEHGHTHKPDSHGHGHHGH